jgi:polar amino acid transport system permease protein
VQFKVLEIFIDAAIYYLVLTTIWGFIQQRIEAHYGRSLAHAPDTGTPPPLALDKTALSHDSA